jgi:hypothetical protein
MDPCEIEKSIGSIDRRAGAVEKPLRFLESEERLVEMIPLGLRNTDVMESKAMTLQDAKLTIDCECFLVAPDLRCVGPDRPNLGLGKTAGRMASSEVAR